jgi:citronellol/citronellal dehydrogenase
VRDFEPYRVDPSMPLAPVFFTPSEPPPPPGVVIDGQRDIYQPEASRQKS